MSELKKLQNLVTTFQQQRDWNQYLLPNNIIQAMMVECAELMEIFQWTKSNENQKTLAEKKTQITDEVADIFAYLLTFCEATDIDLETAFLAKMEKNKTRFPIEKKIQSKRNFLFEFDLGKTKDLTQILEWKYDKKNFKKFIINNPNSYDFFCVVRSGEYCIGHVFVKPKDNNHIDLDALELFEPFRNQGLGKKLIQFTEETCQQKNIKKLCIGAYLDEKYNIKRYQKWGYEITDKTGWCEAAQKKYIMLTKQI